jgi:hypothetical protein
MAQASHLRLSVAAERYELVAGGETCRNLHAPSSIQHSMLVFECKLAAEADS